MVLSVILLVNMLIALMSKTFDLVYENKDVNYTHLYSRLVISYGQQFLLPPPLNLLHLAGKIIHAVWCVTTGVCGLDSFTSQSASIADDDTHPATDEGKWKMRYQLGSTEEEKLDVVREAQEFIEYHSANNGSEALQERCRAGFSQSLSQLARNIEKRMDSVEQALRISEHTASP